MYNNFEQSLIRAVGVDGLFKDTLANMLSQMLKEEVYEKDRNLKDLMRSIKNDAANNTGYASRSSKKNCKKGEKCGSMFELEAIWGYGCFCNFGENWKSSHGKPVNEIDKVCQNLYNCYKCAIIDSEEENSKDTCDPNTQKYKVPIIKNVHQQGTYAACSAMNNRNNCKIRTCCCDLNFAKEILEYFFTGETIDPDIKHSNGFSMIDNCPVCQGKFCQAGSKKCCGEYPKRFPYNTQDGRRACCWKKTYNTNRLQCCEDSFVKALHLDCSD